MARAFRISRRARLRHVVLPQLAPQIAASARAGILFIWKIALVVEFLGRSNGVCFKIHLLFSSFDVEGVLAWRDAVANIRIPTGCDAATARDWLAQVGLAGHEARFPRQLLLG